MGLSWHRLNSVERLRPAQIERSPFDRRSEFDSDYERVVYSSAFRRLQDKTQVFPIESHDFIRTRLTHSCEAAAKGRALGISAAHALHECNRERNLNAADCGTVAATACLLHDIGNPPFGHSGERAIGRWFERLLEREPQKLKLKGETERRDLCEYEGNAHAFRLATRLQNNGKAYGLNLTVATLATLLKYPCASHEATGKQGSQETKKFGYFAADAHAFRRVREATRLPGSARHPLTYLMEAADDIGYSASDIEDALKKRVISYADIQEFLADKLDGDPELTDLLQTQLIKREKELRDELGPQESRQRAYQHFRAVAVGKMSSSCVEAFVDHYDQIMEGDFHGDLCTVMKGAPLHQALLELAQTQVYTHPEINRLELAGERVLSGLLDIVYPAIKAGRAERLGLPVTPRHADDETACSEDYLHALRAADYVAGMTDAFAMRLYRQLTGIEL